jgi:hypothetical protein
MDRVDESTMGNNENDNGGEEAFFDLLTKSLKTVKAGNQYRNGRSTCT